MYRCASTNSVQAVQKIKKKKGGAGVTCRKMSTTCRYTRFLACNTFNVLVLVQETMQKIVSDNLLACYIIYISAKRAEKNRYRVTNRLLVDEAKDACPCCFFFFFFFCRKTRNRYQTAREFSLFHIRVSAEYALSLLTFLLRWHS